MTAGRLKYYALISYPFDVDSRRERPACSLDPTLLERGLTRRVIELPVEEYLHSHGSGPGGLSSWTSNCCLVEKILTETISRLGDISKGRDTVYLIRFSSSRSAYKSGMREEERKKGFICVRVSPGPLSTPMQYACKSITPVGSPGPSPENTMFTEPEPQIANPVNTGNRVSQLRLTRERRINTLDSKITHADIAIAVTPNLKFPHALVWPQYSTLSAPGAFRLHPVTHYGSHGRAEGMVLFACEGVLMGIRANSDFLMQTTITPIPSRPHMVLGACKRQVLRSISRNLLIDLHTRRFRKTEGDHTNIDIMNS
jgi:hypothetical protein